MKKKQAFTLIELLVVISIIAILSLIGLSLFSNAQGKARDAKRKTDLKAIQNAMEMNYNELRGCYRVPVAGDFEQNAVPTDEYRGVAYVANLNSACDYDGDGTADDGYRTYTYTADMENEDDFVVENRR